MGTGHPVRRTTDQVNPTVDACDRPAIETSAAIPNFGGCNFVKIVCPCRETHFKETHIHTHTRPPVTR